MGSADWFEVGGWRGSVQSTLEQLQTEYLASAELLLALPERDELVAAGEDLLLIREFLSEEDVALVHAAMEGLDEAGRPAAREHAVALCAINGGTGTVLDVDDADETARHVDVPNQSGSFTASPLTDPELVEIFGTTTPNRADLDKAATISTFRGDARYIISYDNDVPSAVAFIGASGD